MKNLKEFKDLILTYESITIEQIEQLWEKHDFSDDVAQHLTGFGSPSTCTLCASVGDHDIYINNCFECVYDRLHGCMSGYNKETYEAIEKSKSPEELLQAFHNRANIMKEILSNTPLKTVIPC